MDLKDISRASKRWPNLFLIGAPKCGTTAMSYYLSKHPKIYMSEESGFKEPAFFDADLNAPWHVCNDVEKYLNIFRDAPDDVPYWGEATTSYLYSRVAIPNLLEVSPDAKLIAMVRNPIEMVQSIYNQHVKGHNENTASLRDAWVLQGKRLRGESPLPFGIKDPKIFQYGSISKTGRLLSRVLEVVDREYLHIIIYDDFVENPRREYLDVLEFLGLKDDGRSHFPVLNRRRVYRYPSLHRLLGRLADVRRRLHIPGGWGINSLVDRFNVVTGDDVEVLPADFRDELIDYFREDVNELSALLDRDLSYWLEVPSGESRRA